MVTRCPSCGSAVKDEGRFCSYCGAKLPDDTKRVEVKIDNTAEIKRVEYEEQESLLRQKRMKRDLAREKRKPYLILAIILTVVVPLALAWSGVISGIEAIPVALIGVGFAIVWFLLFMSKI